MKLINSVGKTQEFLHMKAYGVHKTNVRLKVSRVIYSFIPQSVLRQGHSIFQSEFSTQCDLVLPLSISNILFLP